MTNNGRTTESDGQRSHSAVPALFCPGSRDCRRVLKLFTANIRTPHTRKAHGKAASEFAPCCEHAVLIGRSNGRHHGYCLEMICADFPAGASLHARNPGALLQSISRYYRFLPLPQQEFFRSQVNGQLS